LQGTISQPILALAETAQVVSTRQDYSVRAPKLGEDELGALTDAFNQMLGRIEDQNRALRASQDELQRYANELEQRVEARTHELQERHEALRRNAAELLAANSELDAFAYSVSHDLRAPLRSIDGFSQVLLEDYATKLDESGQDSLRRVRAASQRMGILIDDLLKLARVTRAEMRTEPVDLSDMARDIVNELQRTAPERQVACAIAPGLTAEGDARLLRVVLDNLLRNSWKYTAKQPEARVEFGSVEANGGRAFMVRDNGAGFDMKYADKLFGVFQRLHSAADFEGTGVGLATVRRIINRHGGRIWAEGAVGQGATFYFTL
jgi:light-regulated signal transduction histidine kinase (bacteriophytochrome)/HAMP domain-containing protein